MNCPRTIALTARCFIIALAAATGCRDSPTPTQPEPLTDCVIFGVTAVSSLAVGETAILGGYQESCRPMFLPLPPESIAWESLDPAIASVSAGVVTGIAPGPAVIQAAYGSMSQQVLIVVGRTPASPPATPPLRLRMYGAPAMRTQQRGRFGVFAEFGDGTVSPVSSLSTWTSSNSTVAGFSGVGSEATRPVDAFEAGSTRLSATYRGLTATMTVEVRQ